MVHCQMIQAGEIQAIVGDASRGGVGGQQYTGVWSLTSVHRAFNAFGNSYAGLLPGEIRGLAPLFGIIDDTTCILTRNADTPRPVEVRATYQVNPPHYLDHELVFSDKEDLLPKDWPYREVSWCCYMNSPEDLRLHFLSEGEWSRYISPKHGVGSNIAPSYVPGSELEVWPDRGENRPFHWDRAERRFDEPFYYGRLGAMVFVLIFDNPRWLRFFCSPSGGSPSLLPGKTGPAWDFEWLIPKADYEVGREYRFRVRVVYKRYVSDDDVIEEVRLAQKELDFETV